MSRPERIITAQETQKIVAAYKNGTSLRALQKETKLRRPKLRELLRKSGVHTLSAYETQKKQATLEERNYFDELTNFQCYVLGLIFGDGCVHYNPRKYKYAITIVSNDVDILESAQHLFGLDFPITKRKTAKAFNLVINSKHLCEELINKFYLQSPKSNNLLWPILPEEGYSFFVSGLLSTDGCVRIDARRMNLDCGIEFSYSSNCLKFVQQLRQHLSNTLRLPNEGHIKTLQISKSRKNPNYALRYSGMSANKVLEWIYRNTDSLTRCKRKHNIYMNHLAWVSNSII